MKELKKVNRYGTPFFMPANSVARKQDTPL
jgi:hypothetical protein